MVAEDMEVEVDKEEEVVEEAGKVVVDSEDLEVVVNVVVYKAEEEELVAEDLELVVNVEEDVVEVVGKVAVDSEDSVVVAI